MGIEKTTKKNANQMLNSFFCLQKDSEQEKWYSINEDRIHKNEWDKMTEKMITFAESRHPVFRATSPLSRGQLKSKGEGKLSIHCCADLEKVKTVFRTIISVNQLSLYGAVAENV